MLTFRIIKKKDVKHLQLISKKTFSESFAKDNSMKNLKSYFDLAFNLKQLSKELNNSLSRFFFIYIDETLCGYFKINIGDSQTEIKSDDGLELERIYILAEYQGKKIGEKILEKIKKMAMLEHKKYIWLGVWELNTKAIKFYERFGFKKFDTHIYQIGEDAQIDWMMKMML